MQTLSDVKKVSKELNITLNQSLKLLNDSENEVCIKCKKKTAQVIYFSSQEIEEHCLLCGFNSGNLTVPFTLNERKNYAS